MTNEDKAKAIGKSWYNAKCCGVPMDSDKIAEQAALEMAAWKEQQMYEKALWWLDKHVEEYASFDETKADWGNKLEFLEDFKHAMLSKQ